MTVAATTAPAPTTGGSPFTGLPVAQTAGLRLQPGSPTAVFDQKCGICPASWTPRWS